MSKYYIHNTTRGFLGLSYIWWAKDHHGYTANLANAHIFDEEEMLNAIESADDLEAYPVDLVTAAVEHHVTIIDQTKVIRSAEDIPKKEDISSTPSEREAKTIPIIDEVNLEVVPCGDDGDLAVLDGPFYIDNKRTPEFAEKLTQLLEEFKA